MRHNRRHPAYGFQHGDMPHSWRLRGVFVTIFLLTAAFWITLINWLLP